jgi:hypothetical protein
VAHGGAQCHQTGADDRQDAHLIWVSAPTSFFVGFLLSSFFAKGSKKKHLAPGDWSSWEGAYAKKFFSFYRGGGGGGGYLTFPPLFFFIAFFCFFSGDLKNTMEIFSKSKGRQVYVRHFFFFFSSAPCL